MCNLHINALVNLPGNEQIVDFNLGDYNKEYHRRELNDTEVLARYHNNMGEYWLAEKRFRQAAELAEDGDLETYNRKVELLAGA